MVKELLGQINWIDIFLLLILARGLYAGLSNCFLSETIRLIGFLFAVFIALNNFSALGEIVRQKTILTPRLSQIAAFLAIYFTLLTFFRFFRLILRKLIPGIPNLLDRIVGAVLGGARGILLGSFILMAMAGSGINFLETSVTERSYLSKFIIKLGPTAYQYIGRIYPGELYQPEVFAQYTMTEDEQHDLRRTISAGDQVRDGE